MNKIVQGIGVILMIIGVVITINPDMLFSWMGANKDSTWVYIVAILFRLVFGTMLIIVSKVSRYTTVFRILGGISICAAILFMFLGPEVFTTLITTLLDTYGPYGRLSGIASIALGALIYFGLKEKQVAA